MQFDSSLEEVYRIITLNIAPNPLFILELNFSVFLQGANKILGAIPREFEERVYERLRK